jgi:hypothetical protein
MQGTEQKLKVVIWGKDSGVKKRRERFKTICWKSLPNFLKYWPESVRTRYSQIKLLEYKEEEKHPGKQ